MTKFVFILILMSLSLVFSFQHSNYKKTTVNSLWKYDQIRVMKSFDQLQSKSKSSSLYGSNSGLRQIAGSSTKIIRTNMPSIVNKIPAAFNKFHLNVASLLMIQLSQKPILQWIHRCQMSVSKALKLEQSSTWNDSALGFISERANVLTQLVGCNYVVKLVGTLLARNGFPVNSDVTGLLTSISYTVFVTRLLDLFKDRFFSAVLPSVAGNRRQSHVVSRSITVALWATEALRVSDLIANQLKVPLKSILAFGGLGGLLLGLTTKDLAANLVGGMMLLLNDPFTPGDFVIFKSGGSEVFGRVESVGWTQTVVRNKETRPIYVPNAHFVSAAVTNLERITHRKYETTVSLRFQDRLLLPEVAARIKERLSVLPKLDPSLPFRASFSKVGAYSLEVDVVGYFRTKSMDEFAALQQMANLEVLSAVHETGAALALPTSNIVSQQ